MDIMPNNLKRQYELHAAEYEAKALEVLRSGWYVLGKEVAAFEEEFAAYLGGGYCVGLASGLDALWIAFKVLGIGQGDEVIVASNAYIACVMGITMAGATPVFVEPDEYNNLDPGKIEQAVTEKTRAILPVHLYGQACDMDVVMDVAARHGLLVVEDCAQSHGATWKGKATGTFGQVGCFSFYPTKNCGAFGDAGAVVVQSEELAQKFRVFRNYGSSKQYHFDVVGANSRLDEIQAGLLRVRLAHLRDFNAEREAIATRYLQELNQPALQLPSLRQGAQSVWHQFVIHSQKRDALREYLTKQGIGTIIHYPIPPHLSRAYAYLGYKPGDFSVAERFAGEVLSLPIYNGMTEQEQTRVIKAINAFEG